VYKFPSTAPPLGRSPFRMPLRFSRTSEFLPPCSGAGAVASDKIGGELVRASAFEERCPPSTPIHRHVSFP
jgi:hypothetical protein